MKTLKPFKLSLLVKPYTHLGRHHLCVTGILAFRLDKPENIIPEQQLWNEIGSALGGQPLDHGLPKSKAEYLITGVAKAMNKKPVTAMQVTAQVGQLKKSLYVIGDRQARYASGRIKQMSAEQEFISMPLDYQHAYGGKTYALNPLGTGFVDTSAEQDVALPNLFLSKQAASDPSSAAVPACFDRREYQWQPLQSMFGTYDASWRANDFPGFARDLNPLAFNVAHDDQHQDQYFQGNETFQLSGFDHEQAICGVLPALKIRIFLSRKIDGHESHQLNIEEMPVNLDTLHFFTEKNLGLMLYRGQCFVNDSDALDVDSIMLAYEQVGVPRSLDDYQHTYRKRSDPETAASQAFNDAELSPVASDAARLQKAQRMQQRLAAVKAKQIAHVDAALKDFAAQTGHQPEQSAAELVSLDPRSLQLMAAIDGEDMKAGDLDLSEVFAIAKEMAADVEKKAKQQLQELPEKPATDPQITISAEEENALLTARLQAAEPQYIELDADWSALSASSVDQHMLICMQRKSRQISPQVDATLPEITTPCAMGLRHWVESLLAKGGSLAGRDLCGVNLSGMNLSGLDLRSVLLEGANLESCDFSGSDLSGAVLTAAQLSGALFHACRMNAVNLSQSKAKGVDFSGSLIANTHLHGLDWTQAKFTNSVFRDVNMTQGVITDSDFSQTEMKSCGFVQVSMTGNAWCAADLEKMSFVECQLDKNKFNQATMRRCALLKSHGPGSDFSDARMERVQIVGHANFSQSKFNHTQAQNSGFRGSDFSQSELLGAGFNACDFGEVKFNHARIEQSCFYKNVLMSADFSDCQITHDDFYESILRKASFESAKIDEANFYKAELYGININHADIGKVMSSVSLEEMAR